MTVLLISTSDMIAIIALGVALTSLLWTLGWTLAQAPRVRWVISGYRVDPSAFQGFLSRNDKRYYSITVIITNVGTAVASGVDVKVTSSIDISNEPDGDPNAPVAERESHEPYWQPNNMAVARVAPGERVLIDFNCVPEGTTAPGRRHGLAGDGICWDPTPYAFTVYYRGSTTKLRKKHFALKHYKDDLSYVWDREAPPYRVQLIETPDPIDEQSTLDSEQAEGQ